jgi:hypothetical protein
MYMIHANRISIYVFVMSQRHLFGPYIDLLIFGNKKLFCMLKPLPDISFESILSITPLPD